MNDFSSAPQPTCTFPQLAPHSSTLRQMARPSRGAASPLNPSRCHQGAPCFPGSKSPRGVPSQSRGGDTEMLERILQKPKLVVVEEPKERGMRFRYECEGRSAGSILGASSTETNKTQPAVEVDFTPFLIPSFTGNGVGGGVTPYRASNHGCFHAQRLHSRGGGGETCGSVGVSELESTRKPLVRRCQTQVLLSNGCSTPTPLQLINNTRPQSEQQMSQITLSPQTAMIFSTFLRIYLPFSGWDHLANQLTCLAFFCLVSQIQGPIDHLKKVTLTVSLVTKDPPHRPHPHCLVGKDCPEGSGICLVIINPHSNRRHRCRPMSSTRLRLTFGRRFTLLLFFLSLQLRQSWNSVCAEERTGHVPAEEAKPKHRPLSE